MSKSIISNSYQCVVCGRQDNLHRHHIYGGTGRRKISEKYGCWCYLCPEHHNMSDVGVHFNRELDKKLKTACQIAWESRYGDRAEFIKKFGRSYL